MRGIISNFHVFSFVSNASMRSFYISTSDKKVLKEILKAKVIVIKNLRKCHL
jgi:hypothetical protein